MKDKIFATYPITTFDSHNAHVKEEYEVLFDDASRVSYFKSLEKALRNLSIIDSQRKNKRMVFEH